MSTNPDQPLDEWIFSLSSTISTSDVSDSIGAIEFDPSHRLLATAGLARKIRFYILPDYKCQFYICVPAKLSCLRWRPDHQGRTIASADYDGVVTEYDIDTHTPVFERDEHGGRRVWSIDYSNSSPAVGASGSDDNTAQVWDTRCPTTSVAMKTSFGAAVCCVEFDHSGGPAFSVGSADRKAYIYDTRAMAAGPLKIFEGHGKTVTYCRFTGDGRMVTSATDGSHKMWELDSGREVREYKGHVNDRRFIGMTVWREGGLIGCGSESNEVFCYDLRWGVPIWVGDFGEGEEGFVGAVGWRGGEEEAELVAGGSNGVVKVFAGKRRERG